MVGVQTGRESRRNALVVPSQSRGCKAFRPTERGSRTENRRGGTVGGPTQDHLIAPGSGMANDGEP